MAVMPALRVKSPNSWECSPFLARRMANTISLNAVEYEQFIDMISSVGAKNISCEEARQQLEIIYVRFDQ